jgi:predicted GIY-YIG superfamily endonuclease
MVVSPPPLNRWRGFNFFFYLKPVLVEFEHLFSYRRRCILPLRIRDYSLINSRRYYSTTNSHSQHSGSDPAPRPGLNLDLNDKDCIKSYEDILKGKGGIYSLVNTVNGKQYIGSAKDFFIRINEHLKYKNNSNVALQKAFVKYGLDKFKLYIYEYFTYESKIISHKSLTELETSYISKFDFYTLYNFSPIAHNNLGYKHTDESKLKISKPGNLNPMYGKTHREDTKAKMSEMKNKYTSGVGIFDLKGNLISKFKNNVELAKHLNISKVTVGKYLNSKLIYNNSYYFKPITK